MAKRMPDVILQSELGVLAEFEACYFASVKDLADRMNEGYLIEEGPLAIDPRVIASRAQAGAVVVPANVVGYPQLAAGQVSDPCSGSLVEILERLQPISRLLNQADFDFMRRNGLSRTATFRLRWRRVKLYFDYLRLLTRLIDREMAIWARYLGQPQCTFESLDRARWQINRTLWLLKMDGVRFFLHLPVDSQSPARHLGEVTDLIFGFRAATAG